MNSHKIKVNHTRDPLNLAAQLDRAGIDRAQPPFVSCEMCSKPKSLRKISHKIRTGKAKIFENGQGYYNKVYKWCNGQIDGGKICLWYGGDIDGAHNDDGTVNMVFTCADCTAGIGMDISFGDDNDESDN